MTKEFAAGDIFLKRRSVRLMSGERITQDELQTIFEAFRWAPSSYNDQPWRVLYALPGTENWKDFLNFLEEGNRKWAERASVLMVVLAKKYLDHKYREATHHWFDCGAACQNLALQASEFGLATCTIGGFDRSSTRQKLEVPEYFDIPVMIAVGRCKKEISDKLRSVRKKVEDIFAEGSFSCAWEKGKENL
ncbi:nitroreductase family protein [Candidatus Dependentiae bacterium]